MNWRISGGLALVVATGWLLANGAAATYGRGNPRVYPVDFASASWIQVPGGGASGYFRLPLHLDSTPDLATLWIDADQAYQVYANGERVAGSPPAIRSGRPVMVDPVDLSPRLRRGANVLGVRIVNGDDRPAAFRARLTLSFGAQRVDAVTSPATWQATSDPQQVSFPINAGRFLTFSQTRFDASQWPFAVQGAAGMRQRSWSLMPQDVLAGPLAGQVISAAGASTDLVASTVVSAPADPTTAWLRVVSSGPYAVAVDGRMIVDQVAVPVAGGKKPRPLAAAVRVYDVGPFFHGGRNVLSVRVRGGAPSAAIAVDGSVDTPGGTVPIATGPAWHAAGPPLPAAGQTPSKPAVVLGGVSAVWTDGVRRKTVVPDATLPASPGVGPSSWRLHAVSGMEALRLVLVGLLVVLWLGFATVTALVARVPLRRALLLDAAGHLPALAALEAVAGVAHLANWIPPSPYVPVVFWLLVTALAAGKVAAPLALRWPGRSPRLPWGRRPRSRGLRWLGRELPVLELAGGMERPPARSRLALAVAHERAPAGAGPASAGTGTVTVPPDVGRAPRPAGAGTLVWRQAGRALDRLRSRVSWTSRAVVVIAAGGTALMAYRLDYEPASTDEAVSILVAHSIRAHLLPQLPSGVFYFKAELYHYLLAVIGAVAGDDLVGLRLLTVLTYGATVLAFGLLLLPILLRGRRLATVALTLLFATAPQELQQARDARMYQQEQLLVIVFVSLFLLALRAARAERGPGHGSPAAGLLRAVPEHWLVPLSAVALVAMYLSHEETFILLPAIPVVLVAGLGLRWLRDRRWLVWGIPALLVVAAQYGLTIVVRRPALGLDHSNVPYIHYDPSQIYYYLSHYFLAVPAGSGGVPVGSGDGSLYVLSGLAVLAAVVGAVRRDFDRFHLSSFIWLPVLVLSTVFSARAERYIFVLLPMLFALAGLGALDVAGWLRRLLTAPSGGPRELRVVALLVLAAAAPGLVWVGSSLPARVQQYGVAASRLAGVQYDRRQTDYDLAAAYLRAHELPGDIFITLGSVNVAAYYVGRAPDMVIQPHSNRLLYLIEKNGIVVEDYYGRPAILTADDLQQVLAAHRRIWLMTDQGPYLNSVPESMTALIRGQFVQVAAGTEAALYFRGG
ncbi:MAG TPA: hypothetical protein VGO86_19230 [Candidatus Dormibacteraeota bacterium]